MGCGNTTFSSGGKDYIIILFSKIYRTASIASNFESHMLVGKSLSAADKNFMAWVVISSSVTWGFVRYSCKYSDVSIIINALVLLSIAWMQR